VCVGGRDKVVVRLLKHMLSERARRGDYVDSRCKNNAAKTGELDANAPLGDDHGGLFRIQCDDVATTLPFAISSTLYRLQMVVSAHTSWRRRSSGGD
jgi:hypothetical protein